MNMLSRIALPPAIDATAFARRDHAAPVIALAGETMGTEWRVQMVAPARDTARVHQAIVARLATIVAEMSHWDDASLLSRFNRAAPGTWVLLPHDFARVMRCAAAVAEASGGAFDPAIGALVDLWGFGPPGPGPVPDAAAIATACAASGWHRLSWDGAAGRLRQSGGVRLDLSGIAKGYAADAVADLLARLGIHDALVEVGGELVGRGMRPDAEPWWVDLEAPPSLAPAPLRVALHNLAVATSGTYIRGDHNLDPHTGRPAANGSCAVSVVAASAAEADAWATALSVLGPDAGIACANEHGVAARLVGAWGEWLSAAMAAMLED